MMSHPPSSLHQQPRLHRRQNSTPVAFEAMRVHHPTTIQRTNSQHRKGQSFDSRSPIRRQHHRTGSTVSITNIGSTPQGQQILREAQQQRIARPGQQPQIELPASPQCGMYQTMSHSSLPGSPYDNMTINMVTQHTQSMPYDPQYIPQDMGLSMNIPLSMGASLDENNQHYFQNSHIFTPNMIAMPPSDRRMSHPELRIHTSIRPLTPTQQIQTAHFPLTPAATPFRAHHQSQRGQPLQGSPSTQFLNENIRSPHPLSMQKSKSLQGIVEQEEGDPHASLFETADMPIPDDLIATTEPIKEDPSTPSVNESIQQNSKLSQSVVSEDDLPFFDETGGQVQKLDETSVPDLTSSQAAPGSMSPSRPALSPRRMSISDLNLEPGVSASIEETNVTLDDIAQYIEGPDAVDNKWICRFEDCNKRFGRKENIKSHVQTHLGDRQFRCDHCKKCFVRGHDLKRHAKIHTGTKPYPCLCGNAFARHDALTRHRQRGMCIGAFDGIVKKVIKRGRPRKHRPEMDERLEKANKTRHARENDEYGFDQYASSASSCSMSSWGSPPTETMDTLSIRGQSPYDDMNLFGLPVQLGHSHGENIALPPDMFSFTPPASPGYSTGNRPSPSYRELTPAEIAEISAEMSASAAMTRSLTGQSNHALAAMQTMDMPSGSLLMANPMSIQHSQQSLPGLSHSSSSPAADVMTFDFGSDGPSMASIHDMGMNLSSGTTKMAMLDSQHERNDFDSFLDYGSMEMGLDASGNDNFFAM